VLQTVVPSCRCVRCGLHGERRRFFGVDRGVGIHGYSGARTAGLLAAVVLLVVVALVPPTELLKSVSWRADWGTWAATSAPPRVDFCGHHYYPEHGLHSLAWVKAQVALIEKEQSAVHRWTGVKMMSLTPGGTPVLADTPQSLSETSAVFVNVTGNTYEPYKGDAGG
jgi:hypothetical protein